MQKKSFESKSNCGVLVDFIDLWVQQQLLQDLLSY